MLQFCASAKLFNGAVKVGITVAHERQIQALPSPSGDRTVDLLMQPLHAPQSVHVPMH